MGKRTFGLVSSDSSLLRRLNLSYLQCFSLPALEFKYFTKIRYSQFYTFSHKTETNIKHSEQFNLYINRDVDHTIRLICYGIKFTLGFLSFILGRDVYLIVSPQDNHKVC